MKWFAVCAALALAGALLSAAGAQTPSEAAASAELMYRSEEVTGTLVAGTGMYEAGDYVWFLADLRVEEAGAALKRGGTYPIRFRLPVLKRLQGPAIGEQVKMKLWQASPTDEWVATDPPTIVGRGEFVKPGTGAVEDLGKPSAKIIVKMLAPLKTECHQKTAQLLRELAAREPERVRVQIFDMAGATGREEITRERLKCATVLVNNRFEFTIEGPSGKRQVSFQHRPNDPNSAYRSEDVIAVVEQELKRLYPK